jgi:homoserine dehydrogenase
MRVERNKKAPRCRRLFCLCGPRKNSNTKENFMKPVRVGMLGIGTVGSGTYRVLKRNRDEICRRAGRPIDVVMVSARNVERARQVVDGDVEIVADPMLIVDCPDIDIVVEVIGGCTIAKELVLRAIANGKHVVTANKAMLAMHGNEIFAAAREKGVAVAFEGAVAVSIPIIKALRESLTANRIEWVAGIINGTTNFILSEMRDKGLDFDTVLKEAQRLGYAEADPTFDIEGIDAAHKISILSAIAFGIPIQFGEAHIEGIAGLDAVDIDYAERLGYRIKLLGITKCTDKGIELRVHPALVPTKCLLASVEGSMNGIMVQGDAAGTTMYCGAGAGSEETAGAVIADLIDIARLANAAPGHRVPYLAFQPDAIVDMPVLPIAEIVTRFYLRMPIVAGQDVVADITRILASETVSIEAISQSETDIVMLTHRTQEKNIDAAIAGIEAMPSFDGRVTKIRLEALA